MRVGAQRARVRRRADAIATTKNRRRRPRESTCDWLKTSSARVAILPAGRVRDERRRADAEHLRHREHDEHQVAGDADGGDGLRAEAADPVQIDQEVQRLEDHRHEHEAGGLEQMPRRRDPVVIHAALASRAITCTQLVRAYLDRIQAYDDKGPTLQAIINVNPRAIEIAEAMDRSSVAGTTVSRCTAFRSS